MEKKTENSETDEKETFLSKIKGKQMIGLVDQNHITDVVFNEAENSSSSFLSHSDYLHQNCKITYKLSGLLNACLQREALIKDVNEGLIETVKEMNGSKKQNDILKKLEEFTSIHQDSFQALNSALEVWHDIKTNTNISTVENQKANISNIIYEESNYRDAWVNIQSSMTNVIEATSNESIKCCLKEVSNQFLQICESMERKEKDFWRKQQQFSQITWKMQQLNSLSDCLMQEYKHNKSKVDDLVKVSGQLKKQLQKSEEEKQELSEKLLKLQEFQNNEVASSNGVQVTTLKEEVSHYKNTVNTLKTRINTLEQQLQDQQTSSINFSDLLELWKLAIAQDKPLGEDEIKFIQTLLCNECQKETHLKEKSSSSLNDSYLLKNAIQAASPKQNRSSSLKCKHYNWTPTKIARKSLSPQYSSTLSDRSKLQGELLFLSQSAKSCQHNVSELNVEMGENLIAGRPASAACNTKLTSDLIQKEILNNEKIKSSNLKKAPNVLKRTKTFHGEPKDYCVKYHPDWKFSLQLANYEKRSLYLKETRPDAEIKKSDNSKSSRKEDFIKSNYHYKKQIYFLQDYIEHERYRHEAELRKNERAHKKQLTFLQKDCIQIFKNINRFRENIVNLFDKERFSTDAKDMRDINAINVVLEDTPEDIISALGRNTPQTLIIFNAIENKLCEALNHLKHLYKQDYLFQINSN